MVYQYINQNGEKEGIFSIKKQPKAAALAASKSVIKKYRPKSPFDILIVKNQTYAEGGDKLYKYRVTYRKHKPMPILNKSGEPLVRNGQIIYKKIDIHLEKL